MREHPHTHIFIGGLHRSGTSILHRLLRAHPDISGFSNTGAPEDEGQHLETVFPHAHPIGKFSFEAKHYLTEISPLITPENRKKLWREWSMHWDLKKPFLIEKSPPTIIHSRFLQAFFPNSMFIFIVRHPLAVGYATLQKWGKKWDISNIREVTEHWALSHQVMLEDINHINKYVILRYEDFVAAPELSLKKLHNFIGISNSLMAETVTEQSNQKYFSMWEKEIEKDPIMLQRLRLMLPYIKKFGYYLMPPYVRTPEIAVL